MFIKSIVDSLQLTTRRRHRDPAVKHMNRNHSIIHSLKKCLLSTWPVLDNTVCAGHTTMNLIQHLCTAEFSWAVTGSGYQEITAVALPLLLSSLLSLSLLLLLYAFTSSWELELRIANTVRVGGLVSKQMAQVRSYQRNKQTKLV